MRISGPGSTTRLTSSRREAQASRKNREFSLSQEETSATQGSANVQSLASMDALIALQETPDAMARKRKAIKRGEQMLELLEEIKVGLLSGGLSRSRLKRLSRLLQEHREASQNPELDGVLDEIELRAQVELAKLENAA